MQAKDITDEDALARVRAVQRGSGELARSSWFDIEAGLPPEIPRKVMRAKLASLIRRKKLKGCACGCRGDFEIVGT